MLVELGIVQQRLQAVLEVLNDGATVTDVARRDGVSRQTVHAWLKRVCRFDPRPGHCHPETSTARDVLAGGLRQLDIAAKKSYFYAVGSVGEEVTVLDISDGSGSCRTRVARAVGPAHG